MKGLNYINNDKGEQIAVIIDLKKYGKIWEDFYDVLIAEERKNDLSIPWEKAKQLLRKKKRSL